MRRSLALAALLALAAFPALAQRAPAAPRRPALPAGADTADALSYYNLGVSRLDGKAPEAAAAFYWASRLDPAWADPYYARRVALLMADRRRLLQYMEGNRRVMETPEMRQLDSLQLQALAADPYLYRKFDRALLTRWFQESAEQDYRREGLTPNSTLISHWIAEYLLTAPPYTRGWMSYSDGRFTDALGQYAQSLRGARRKSGIHADRARVFFLTRNYDSAITQMQKAVEEFRARDRDELVVLYESKAVYEHSIGMAEERRGNAAAAREAYGRALQENLAYHPAHVRLSALALAAGDTATAVSEMDLAVQIRPGDAGLRASLAQVLLAAGRHDEAAEHAHKALELEPFYALPHLLLGRAHEGAGRKAEALASYRAFAAGAARRDPQLGWAAQRVALLGAPAGS